MRDHQGQVLMSDNLQFAKGVLLIEDCEGTCNWSVTGTDAAVAVTFETAAAFMGTKGMQLYSGNDSAAEDDTVQAFKVFQRSETGLVVFRARVCLPDVSEFDGIALKLFDYDGTDVYEATIQWDVDQGKVYYKNSGGTYTEMATMAVTVDDGFWGMMEIVADMNTHQFISATVNGVKVSLADIGMYDSGNDTDKQMMVTLWVQATAEAPVTAYFDSIYCGEFLNV